MNILAIETSCDDTCIAIANIDKQGFKILSDTVSSQVKLHAKYGGVYPLLAKREHKKNLPLVFKKVLKKAGNPKIDLIAVTIGPGLEPCLWQGVNFAKDLAKKLNIKIIPINHIEAHILVNFIDSDFKKNMFPAICLIVSGGHTQLILMKNFGNYKILGETRDDAAGECFDKTARILGLKYPGGPEISKKAKEWKLRQNQESDIKLPRPMIYQKNYDFSFSGLKTATLYKVKKENIKTKKYVQAMSFEIQQAIIDVLIKKTIKASGDYKAKTIIIGGGVTANKELRSQFKEIIKKKLPKTKLLIPDIKNSTDNAIMIATTAYFHSKKEKGESWEKISANANLRI